MTGLAVSFQDQLESFRLDAAFVAPEQGITTLYGPSGCGKTTVLRCIAGLHRAKAGRCALGRLTWQHTNHFTPPHLRPIGYVFQEPSLFAHLSVRGNLLYGAPRDSEAEFRSVTALLGLQRLLDRAPRHLSGGERQRVAIGRALLSRPLLLLMDEPLSALDRASKEEILPYLEQLHTTLALPVIYVSHDMTEVERLADQLVMMDGGRVIAAGPIAELQSDPRLPLAAARQAAVSLDAVVQSNDHAYGLTRLQVEGASFVVPSAGLAPGTRQRLRILASDVSLAREPPGPSTISNIVPARILSAHATSAHEMTVVLGLGPAGAGSRLLSRVTRHSWERLELAPGCELHAQIKAAALMPHAINE